MWSLGVILYELCTFQKPFVATSMEELKEKVIKDKPQVNEIKIGKEFGDLIGKLLRKNPIHRPSIKEII